MSLSVWASGAIRSRSSAKTTARRRRPSCHVKPVAKELAMRAGLSTGSVSVPQSFSKTDERSPCQRKPPTRGGVYDTHTPLVPISPLATELHTSIAADWARSRAEPVQSVAISRADWPRMAVVSPSTSSAGEHARAAVQNRHRRPVPYKIANGTKPSANDPA